MRSGEKWATRIGRPGCPSDWSVGPGRFPAQRSVNEVLGWPRGRSCALREKRTIIASTWAADCPCPRERVVVTNSY